MQLLSSAGNGTCNVCRADHVASSRATEQRKALGHHEEHERHRLGSRQHSLRTQRTPQHARSSISSSSSGQTCLSVVAVAAVFAGIMYWSVVLLLPK